MLTKSAIKKAAEDAFANLPDLTTAFFHCIQFYVSFCSEFLMALQELMDSHLQLSLLQVLLKAI